jgi:tripartite ATP-independent transporter DctM subunit
MRSSGLADRLIEGANTLSRKRDVNPGVLTILGCSVFGAISGSGASAVAAFGPIMMPRLIARGYTRGYATALVSCSAVLSLLIPPSVPMIIFAQTINIPAAYAFLATVGPAILIICALILSNRFIFSRDLQNDAISDAQKMNSGSSHQRGTLRRSVPAFLLPIFVLGGIYGGFVTPTEAAAVACGYCILFRLVSRAEATEPFMTSLERAGMVTGSIIIILFFLMILSRLLVFEQIPIKTAELLLSISDNRIVILLMVNAFLLLMGMFVDDVSGTILAAIVLSPLMQKMGIDPIHFAAIVGTNLGMGNVTPPLAPFLFISGSISGASLREYVAPTLKMLVLAYLPIILLVTYLPEIALFIPRMIIG